MQLTTKATHSLEIREQASLERPNVEQHLKSLTCCRAEGQASSGEPKCSPPRKPLTSWRARNQQSPHATHQRSHSLSGEPRRDVVSRVQMQLTSEATHELD